MTPSETPTLISEKPQSGFPPLDFDPDSQPNFAQRHPIWCGVAIALIAVVALLSWGYVKFSRTIAARLEKEPQGNVAVYYAAPRVLAVGEGVSLTALSAQLHEAGYPDHSSQTQPYYLPTVDSLEIHPSPSYASGAARITFQKNRIASIVSLTDGRAVRNYALEPRPFANLEGQNRERRDDLRFAEIPPTLVNAILSAEDKHFFHHPGFDPARIAKAIYVNWKSGAKEQGGSTLTMQLARNLWLNREKTWKRKAMESLITIVLERKLTKQQILEMYCNKIYLGRHANYSIYGFGTAARAYFDKDVHDLTLPEAALLAGMAQRPTYFDPIRNPQHATERRNLVLELMRQNKYIDDATLATATEAPLALKPRILETDGAPYFLSLANDEAQAVLGEDSAEFSGARIYTTLDQDLQNDAREAVEQGMKTVFAEIKAGRKKNSDGALPQVALIALDPQTGEVKAVIGGRNYAESQLNHALSKRQPGSVFKPFVYAAALAGSLNGFGEPMTLLTTVEDVPTTFRFGRQRYTPGNFGQHYFGTVTLRQALAHSLNVATIKVAERTGYDRVVGLARNAGLNDAMRPTPSVALGSYEATPLEIAGAYTVFANHGIYTKPTFLTSVQLPDRSEGAMRERDSHQVLDPRVSFLMLEMLQEVVRSGTAARVRSLGLTAPVAGKTGTSRDGWFAGFSSGLLCIVWVGYDDNRELGLEGAKSALPIWVEFMKRALRRPDYAQPFNGPPAGVSMVKIDPTTGLLAGPNCQSTQQDYFIDGTEPGQVCELHAAPPAEPPSPETPPETPPAPPPQS